MPDYGARVVALTDLRKGRQWLVTGPQSAQTSEDAVYGAGEAIGWDECFPTVLPCAHPAWAGPLRDHGALWGRKWAVVRAEPHCIETHFETPLFKFVRVLTAQGATVTADYRVSNLGTTPLPYLWSQHCLLATNPGERIVVQGQSAMMAADQPFDWPQHPDRDLRTIGPISEGFAIKAYATAPGGASGGASAAVIGPGGGLRFDWTDLPALGIWLCYGGWPTGNGVHQVALEPTTAMADHLNAAETLAQARVLGPAETHRWSVRLTLTDPDSLNGPDERTLQ